MGRCCPHLSLEERRKIAKWLEAKMPAPVIADWLGRAPSTIYRTLKRLQKENGQLRFEATPIRTAQGAGWATCLFH